jgi:hypothetical protein
LHREALALLDVLKSGSFYLDSPQQTRAAHKVILKEEMRTNTYDKVT